GEPQHNSVERGEIWRALSGSIADQQLMFEKESTCSGGTCATWAEELCDCYEHMNGEDGEFAHGANATTLASDPTQ
ncbi:MAG: hypothetical protein ACXW20_06385, partial [Burkholderiales bacterium]